MRDDQYQFLSVYGQLPARLHVEQAAWVLGFAAHDLPVLVSVGLLKPLGRPAKNGSKYFATAELQVLRNDTRWLAKASDAVANHWRVKNARRSGGESRFNKPAGQPAGVGVQ